METGAIYVFSAESALEALEKMRYTLSLSDKRAEECRINQTASGMNLYLIYKGNHYVSNIHK